MSLTGPSRTIIVEPVKVPAVAPVTKPVPQQPTPKQPART
jgi:hypothetical protein